MPPTTRLLFWKTTMRLAVLTITIAGLTFYFLMKHFSADQSSQKIDSKSAQIEQIQATRNATHAVQPAGPTLSATSGIVTSVQHLPALDQLSALSVAARQHAAVAATLIKTLGPCTRQQQNSFSWKRSVDQKISSGSFSPTDQASAILELEKKPNDLARHCAGLDQQTARTKAFEYIEIAAQLGDPHVQARYAFDARAFADQDYAFRNPQEVVLAKEKAIQYANQAALAGSADAMETLGTLHSSGYFNTDNPVLAAAYYLAASMNGKPHLRSLAERRISGLPSKDADRARILASQILQAPSKR